MDKTDFKRTLKALYQPSAKHFSVVTVPRMNFLKFDGSGPPGNQAYEQACNWLYATSYGVKFAARNNLGKDYVIAPLEGLWWAGDMSAYTQNRRDEWIWSLMIMQPEWITAAMVKDAIDAKRAKLGDPPAGFRFEPFDEGLCVQIMHVGPYTAEGPTIRKLHEEFLPANGYVENGEHHEIYISDPRRCAPEKLKTILRQPVRPVES